MPRMQVYLPENLHRAVKKHGLPASELLQGAVRQELARRKLEREHAKYLAALVAEVGEPDEEEIAEIEQRLDDAASRAKARKAG